MSSKVGRRSPILLSTCALNMYQIHFGIKNAACEGQRLDGPRVGRPAPRLLSTCALGTAIHVHTKVQKAAHSIETRLDVVRGAAFPLTRSP